MNQYPDERDPQSIRRDGVFDVCAAQEVAHQLADAQCAEEIHLDLTHIREFHDFGVAVLAKALATCPAHVSVYGLRHHHRRLLRYLGFGAHDSHAAA